MYIIPQKIAAVLPSLIAAVEPATAQTPNAGTPDFFENKVRPILANNCFGCHTNSQLGGLSLDTLEGMKKGGNRGPAIVPGDAENSLLIKAVRPTDPALKMPSGGKLKPSEIEDLEAWVKRAQHGPPVSSTMRSSPNPSNAANSIY